MVGDHPLTTRRAAVRWSWRAAWVAPAVLGSLVTGYLAWGAWFSAADRPWLYESQAWWRVWLRPGNVGPPLVFVALWLAALLCYWYPRRRQAQVVGITTVVSMVVIGGVLTIASLAPCRAGQTPSAVAGWVFDLYVGNPPSFPIRNCTCRPRWPTSSAAPSAWARR